MTLFRFSTLMVCLGICIYAMPVDAAETIHFSDKKSFKNSALKTISKDRDFSKIAAIDLNNDSIDEYIIARSLNDETQRFEILADTDNGFTALGVIEAQKLMIAYSTNHGVRNLLGFYDADNDFDYNTYLWDAQNSRYSRKQDINRGGVQ